MRRLSVKSHSFHMPTNEWVSMGRRKRTVKSVKSGRLLRHTKSKSHNANEIDRWKNITGVAKPSCCVSRTGKIPKGPNKGKDIKNCSKGRFVGAHVRFEKSSELYIVPVCNKHNDTGWKAGCFGPGDWFKAKKTKAVRATNTSLPKNRAQQQKKRRKKRRKVRFSNCNRRVLGSGRCHLHKHKRQGSKRVRKGICGARIQK